MKLKLTLTCFWLLAFASAQNSDQLTNPLTACSKLNTSPGNGKFNRFNSYGSCTEACGGFAFAIMQGFNCWCSDYAPEDTVPLSECSDPCGGFSTDRCGNVEEGLFGYAQIAQASGTMAPSSSTTSTSTSATSTSSSSTVTTTSTSTSSTTNTLTTSTSSTSPTTTSTTSISSTSSMTPPSSTILTTSGTELTTILSPSVSVTTVNNSIIRTVTFIPSETPSPTAENSAASTPTLATTPNPHKNGFWSNGGKVAGTFVGVGCGVVLLVGLLLLFFYKRRQQARHDLAVLASPHESDISTVFHKKGSFYHRQQNSVASDADTNFVPILDQRMEPTQMYMHWDKSDSQISLADHEDYSRRVLRVTNPDAQDEKTLGP